MNLLHGSAADIEQRDNEWARGVLGVADVAEGTAAKAVQQAVDDRRNY